MHWIDTYGRPRWIVLSLFAVFAANLIGIPICAARGLLPPMLCALMGAIASGTILYRWTREARFPETEPHGHE